MKTIATLLVCIIGISAFAENEKYYEAMGKALESFGNSTTVEDFTKAANQFKMIANVENEEWLPLYYNAQCYILIAFKKELPATDRDNYLDMAQESIDKAINIDDKESEIYALQSMLYTARLVIDPMNRGRKMMGASGSAIKKALNLNPNNPRAQYLLLSNEVGQAQFFGKDTAPFCERINELHKKWDQLNEVPKLYPTWGKKQVEGMAKNCQSKIKDEN